MPQGLATQATHTHTHTQATNIHTHTHSSTHTLIHTPTLLGPGFAENSNYSTTSDALTGISFVFVCVCVYVCVCVCVCIQFNQEYVMLLNGFSFSPLVSHTHTQPTHSGLTTNNPDLMMWARSCCYATGSTHRERDTRTHKVAVFLFLVHALFSTLPLFMQKMVRGVSVHVLINIGVGGVSVCVCVCVRV